MEINRKIIIDNKRREVLHSSCSHNRGSVVSSTDYCESERYKKNYTDLGSRLRGSIRNYCNYCNYYSKVADDGDLLDPDNPECCSQ